jgi:hypothetical protein
MALPISALWLRSGIKSRAKDVLAGAPLQNRQLLELGSQLVFASLFEKLPKLD